MKLVVIENAVRVTGLGVVGAFHAGENDDTPPGVTTVVLLGPVDGAMWASFRSAPEAADGLLNPLDRWSRRTIDELAANLGAAALYPFGSPPWHPFQRWAERGEGAVVSPVSMQATASRGLWASYRGALAFNQRLDLPERGFTNPCLGCPAPCVTACPVDAFAGGAFDVAACVTHVAREAGRTCRSGCVVRASCPAGAAFDLPKEQRAFHMAAFLAAHAQSPPEIRSGKI